MSNIVRPMFNNLYSIIVGGSIKNFLNYLSTRDMHYWNTVRFKNFFHLTYSWQWPRPVARAYVFNLLANKRRKIGQLYLADSCE